MAPSTWAWRSLILKACEFWESQCGQQVFRYSDHDPHDINIIRIHITEDFCTLRFFKHGERVVDVDTYLPPAIKERLIARALGLAAGLPFGGTQRSVMSSSPADGKYVVHRWQKMRLLELLG